MNSASFQNQLRDMRAFHAARLAAIDVLLEPEHDGQPQKNGATYTSPKTRIVAPRGQPRITTVIMSAIREIHGSFDLASVASLVPTAKRAQISTVLYRLKKSNQIRTVKEGSGRKAGTYAVLRNGENGGDL